MMKRKRGENNQILFCCHSSWVDENGFTTVPENTFIYIYAPLGAVLSQAISKRLLLAIKSHLEN
jgi:hypothetical protein